MKYFIICLLFGVASLSVSAQIIRSTDDDSAGLWLIEEIDTITTYDQDTYEEILLIVRGHDTIRRHVFESVHIGRRTVDVWVPVRHTDGKPLSVLYMHDGQMIFDHKHTWNRQSWDAHGVARSLLILKKTPPFLIVGVHSIGERRHADYFPQKPFEAMTERQRRKISNQLKLIGRSKGRFAPDSDDYLRFLVEELKPFIDSTYPVLTDREHTCIAGSSMGGLISLYALCEYPETFGAAACLSTHWPGTFTVKKNPFPEAMRSYLRSALPPPLHHRIWFDHGDQTLDALYPQLQAQVDTLLREKGYGPNQWTTRTYPGTDHSEKSWSHRLPEVLEWLMKAQE